MSRERGIALIVVLIALAVTSALALGLVLVSTSDRLAAANFEDGLAAANAAEAALHLAVHELGGIEDWDAVLGGTRQSRFFEGVAPVDLAAETNAATCGRSSCTDARRRASTADRPWGANNPAWQLFLRAPFSRFVNIPGRSADTYIVAWVGDDARETDGDPLRDGGVNAGRDVVRVRAEAFGRRGARHAIEADVIREAAGIRVQSWRVR